MSEGLEVLSEAETTTILHLALAEVARLQRALGRKDKSAEMWESLAENSDSVSRAYSGELQLIAESLSVEGIGEIRDAIRALITQRNELFIERAALFSRALKAEQEARGYHEAIIRIEAEYAALRRAAWLFVNAPTSDLLRAEMSTTYEERRQSLLRIFDSSTAGRALLLELEQANERAEQAERTSATITRRWGDVQRVIETWNAYAAQRDTKDISAFYALADALNVLANMEMK